MKRTCSVSCSILFILSSLLLFGKIVCSCIGYTLKLANAPVYAVIICILGAFAAMLSIISGKTERKAVRTLLIITVPLSVVNILLYLFEDTSTLVYVCKIISAIETLFLAVWHGRNLSAQIIGSVLAVLILFAVCYLGFFCLLFGNIGTTTVARTVESPAKMYRAEVLDVDQGALGGDTVVNIYQNSKYHNLLILTISKKPQRVYIGQWGEAETMELYWKSENCLVINSNEYRIE